MEQSNKGTKEQRNKGTQEQRNKRTKEQRNKVIKEPRNKGTTEQQNKGTKEQRNQGTKEQRNKKTKSSSNWVRHNQVSLSSFNPAIILIIKKSRIRETKHLSTDADSSTDTTVEWTKNTQKPDFF